MMKNAFVFILTSFLVVEGLWAAACCSGGAAVPSIITGDDRFQLRTSADAGFVVGDVNSEGKSRFNDDMTEDLNAGFLLSSAYRFHEDFQAGFKLPLRTRHIESESSTGFGDLKLNLAWEPFPIYRYSAWRPKLFVFTAMTFPTGKSTHETADDLEGSFGRGFFAPSLGFVAIKVWKDWDFSVAGEWLYQFERSFERESVDPGSIYTASLGGGYSFYNFRIGASLGPNYEEPKTLKRSSTTADERLVWDSVFEVAYNASDRMSYQLGYLDQSLMGPAKNVTLTRSFTFSFTYRLPV